MAIQNFVTLAVHYTTKSVPQTLNQAFLLCSRLKVFQAIGVVLPCRNFIISVKENFGVTVANQDNFAITKKIILLIIPVRYKRILVELCLIKISSINLYAAQDFHRVTTVGTYHKPPVALHDDVF